VLASSASSQYLETTIKLPDTLGPLNGPYHLAWDENPSHPRLYIGGEGDSGGVIVAEAITCERLARVSTGPVKALCFVPPHRKLYVAMLGTDSVLVVDCATNQITAAIHTAGVVPVMQYNSQNDRLYCGGEQISVIDCAVDSMVGTIPVATSAFGYDSASNKLYVGGSGPLAVIDCASDSIVASLPEVDSAKGLCVNTTAGKVYVASGDTLYAIHAGTDSIAARLHFSSLAPTLACDPLRNRTYCSYSGYWASIDCLSDTVTLTYYVGGNPDFLACNTARDRLYFVGGGAAVTYDATIGPELTHVMLDGLGSGSGWSPGLDRLYCPPWSDGTGYSTCLLSAVDGTGDSIAGVVPLTMRAENIVLDTVRNRLYFTYGSSSGCGCVGVVDCAQNAVTSYVYGGEGPYAMCYNANNNRLYWRTGGHSVTVYDCSTNTRVGRIQTSGVVDAARLHLALNKLYAFSHDSQGRPVIEVVDCDRDSVIHAVHLTDGYLRELLLVPEDNTLWYLAVHEVAAIDCTGDSIVADEPVALGSIDDACACPEDRRVYAGWSEKILAVNMDKPAEVDTLHPRIPDGGIMRFLSMPGAHKAYWVVNYSPHSARLFVIDTRTSTLVDSTWLNRGIAGMCLDRTGSYVYCVPYASMTYPTAMVIDTRVDSVVATFELPPMIVAKKNPLVPNRATNRIYVAQSDVYIYGNEIPVIRDSMLIGVEEMAQVTPSRLAGPTVVRHGVPLGVWTQSELWDATGRRVAVLSVGLNDINHLAPGVYFCRQTAGFASREGPQAPGHKPQATRKVVIAE
jgi:hypothetical protein